MSNILNQFRSFYFKNYPDDMEILIEYFAIFGGCKEEIDTSEPLKVLIKEHILDSFQTLNEKIENLTLSQVNNKRLLRALAIGDRRIFSAFNKAGLNNGNGGAALQFLQEKNIVSLEYSREQSPKKTSQKLKRSVARHRISHKVHFTQPFIRFWFYFVSPYKKEISQGHYENFFANFDEKENSYTSLVFEELSEVLLAYHIRDSQIISSGSYWDANVEIDVLIQSEDNKTYVAECKWRNHKVNKKEWHKLLEKCKNLNLIPTQIALFSKRGFSKELLSHQGKELALYSCQDFEILLQH